MLFSHEAKSLFRPLQSECWVTALNPTYSSEKDYNYSLKGPHHLHKFKLLYYILYMLTLVQMYLNRV